MNDFIERLAVENSNKCNELGREIEDLKREMFDLQCNYNIVVGKHNELADRINKAIEYIKEEKEEYEKGKLLYKEFGRELEQYTKGQLVAYKHIEDILKGEENEER